MPSIYSIEEDTLTGIADSIRAKTDTTGDIPTTSMASMIMSISGGGTGGEDKTYVHSQTSASSSWSITHSLAKYPSVTVVDSSGDVIIGEVNYESTSKVTITFSEAISGKAFLN